MVLAGGQIEIYGCTLKAVMRRAHLVFAGLDPAQREAAIGCAHYGRIALVIHVADGYFDTCDRLSGGILRGAMNGACGRLSIYRLAVHSCSRTQDRDHA